LDCNQSFPNNPGDFRFQGVDGRGKQTLVRDPRSTGGVAVIRLEDPKGGSEGYTGDIMWKGGDSNWGGGGNWSSGGSGWNDSWQGQGSGISYKDAVAVCRNQVSRVRGVNANSVAVRRSSSGGSNRNFDLEFNFRDRSGNNQNGNCSVSTSGQLSNFKINGGGYNDRASSNQAMAVCEREIERRLQIGPNDARVQIGNDSGNGNYNVNWQGRRRNGTVATGQCTVAPNGQISDFSKW